MNQPQTDCRHFLGFKPCGKNTNCIPTCPSKEIAYPHILIIHLEALGAVLRGTVVLTAIKRKYPRAHITWITSSAAVPLLESNPHIDRLLKNDHLGVLALSNLEFDLAFCIDKSLWASGLLIVPAKIKEKRGYGASANGAITPLNPEAQRLYELGLSDFEKFHVNRTPENQLIVESLGLDFINDKYIFEFTESEKKFRDEEKKRLAIASNTISIGLNTGCSNVIPYKKLSVSGWVSLIHKLFEDFPNAKFLLLGGPEDTTRNLDIARRVSGPLIVTPTESGLRRGMIYLDLCDVIVTGDSLGMHMAIALEKWAVTWFGPTCAHEIDFYEKGEAILTHATCGPCWSRNCNKTTMCYDLVSWEEIANAVARGIKNIKKKIPAFQDQRREIIEPEMSR